MGINKNDWIEREDELNFIHSCKDEFDGRCKGCQWELEDYQAGVKWRHEHIEDENGQLYFNFMRSIK